ncbi:hypothetical protein [Hymenobacter sublimis]|uniref:DUF4926 domain-containing protein n=1 Tax=Hymenobacter sublimis TaxID=2933777 RepID=A0ABY4JH65_9BACT|nr:hypothetical protein [Hymenobacter sublimis]UPL51393.1 hypothetical protein MWH26_19860 [Hymenobacter sublimis]
MPKVCLMEFDREARHFQFLAEVELSSVPTKGDKVTLNIGEEQEGFVFEVYDVHYTDHSLTDVNIIRISNVNDYFSSRFPDIV